MRDTTERWVLAFDASCGTCNRISVAVAEACGGKLEVLPLVHRDVRQWRERAGAAAREPVPTLFRVRGEQADMWTGPRLGLHLMGRLGPASTARVLRALGALDGSDLAGEAAGARAGIGRKDFLRLGTGAALAASVLLVGKTPALAGARDATSQAHAWARLNKDKLPQTYDDLARYPLAYRRAIFVELPAAQRSKMWCEHLASYRASKGAGLSQGQVKVLDSATRLARDHATFTSRSPGRIQREKALSELREAAITAFGNEEAKALLATLGPVQASLTPLAGCPGCECSTQDDYCWPAHCCPSDCGTSARTCWCSPPDSGGCGTFYSYDCNGMCGGWPGGNGCPGRCG
ncbi:MAG: bacteriocin fulvocin C-related protein [Streptosporangiaceae bacterium]|nr:bacteriocin fulvocin C-related protein [Streptosporangiaceae bacterium]